ncbi:MAG: 50S ribosomal protein L17 [bacterium]|nr:50S ribosomal protein L17 [bacterium]
MRKNVFGRKLSRDKNERTALFKGLMSSLIIYERIKTTEQKAKSIKGGIEKLVTHVNTKGQNPSLLAKHLTPKAIRKLISDIAPRFVKKPGGYTRIVRLQNRFGDNARVVLIEWTEGPKQVAVVPVQKEKKLKKIKEEKPAKKEVKKVKKEIKKKK